MRFCHVTFMVKNLDESLRFYQDIIGLTLLRRFRAGDDLEIAFVGNGDTEIEFIESRLAEKINIGPDVTLGFEVADLKDSIQLLCQHGISCGETVLLGPQARCVYIFDPNGIRVQLIEYTK